MNISNVVGGLLQGCDLTPPEHAGQPSEFPFQVLHHEFHLHFISFIYASLMLNVISNPISVQAMSPHDAAFNSYVFLLQHAFPPALNLTRTIPPLLFLTTFSFPPIGFSLKPHQKLVDLNLSLELCSRLCATLQLTQAFTSFNQEDGERTEGGRKSMAISEYDTSGRS